MPRQLVHSYLGKFNLRQQTNTNDSFAPRAAIVLRELLNELEDRPPLMLSKVYPSLGYSGGPGFSPDFALSNNTLASYVLMEHFIKKLNEFKLDSAVADALKPFQTELLATLASFKKVKALTTALQLSQKDTLQALLASLLLLIESPIEKNALKGIQNATTDIFQCYAMKNLLLDMKKLSEVPNLYVADLIKLQQTTLLLKKNVLGMPEIKEMDRFIWLLNVLCDFINNHICYVFESNKVKSINTFFAKVDKTIKENDKSIEQYAEELSNGISL